MEVTHGERERGGGKVDQTGVREEAEMAQRVAKNREEETGSEWRRGGLAPGLSGKPIWQINDPKIWTKTAFT